MRLTEMINRTHIWEQHSHKLRKPTGNDMMSSAEVKNNAGFYLNSEGFHDEYPRAYYCAHFKLIAILKFKYIISGISTKLVKIINLLILTYNLI